MSSQSLEGKVVFLTNILESNSKRIIQACIDAGAKVIGANFHRVDDEDSFIKTVGQLMVQHPGKFKGKRIVGYNTQFGGTMEDRPVTETVAEVFGGAGIDVIISYQNFSNVSTAAGGDHEALDGELDHIKSSLRNTGQFVKEFIDKWVAESTSSSTDTDGANTASHVIVNVVTNGTGDSSTAQSLAYTSATKAVSELTKRIANYHSSVTRINLLCLGTSSEETYAAQAIKMVEFLVTDESSGINGLEFSVK